jgi:hypothetical protein
MAKKANNHGGRGRMKTSLLCCAILSLSGCATMHKPGETPEQVTKDQYECHREAYTAMSGKVGLVTDAMYRDCLRARGYK